MNIAGAIRRVMVRYIVKRGLEVAVLKDGCVLMNVVIKGRARA